MSGMPEDNIYLPISFYAKLPYSRVDRLGLMISASDRLVLLSEDLGEV